MRASTALVFLVGACTTPSLEESAPPSTPEEQPVGVTRILAFSQVADAFAAVDDRVMGGVSQSRLERRADHAAFNGVVSLDNNGGFASVLAPTGRLDLSSYSTLILRVRGDGKRYKLRLRDGTESRVTYQAAFTTESGVWQELALPLTDFKPVRRGRPVRGAEPLARNGVQSIGLLISDEQTGPFTLEVDWLGAR